MSDVLPVPMRVRLVRAGATLPTYAHRTDSGLDLRAYGWRWPSDPKDHARETSVELAPLERILLHTGIAVELPEGHEAQVRPRSGLSLNDGLHVVLGTIDEGYVGEISVTVVNMTSGRLHLAIPSKRAIAQLVIAPVRRVQPVLALELAGTERGTRGYGSSDPKGAA